MRYVLAHANKAFGQIAAARMTRLTGHQEVVRVAPGCRPKGAERAISRRPQMAIAHPETNPFPFMRGAFEVEPHAVCERHEPAICRGVMALFDHLTGQTEVGMGKRARRRARLGAAHAWVWRS